MRRLLPISLLALCALPALALDLCPWPSTVRGSVPCPVGVSSAVCVSSAGAPLSYVQADKNFLNTVGICAVEDRIVVTGAVCAAGELPVFTVDGWVCSVLSGVPGRIGSGQLPVSFNAPTATALAANPPACSVGQYVTDIAADGTPTCAQVAYSQISGTPASGIVGSLGLSARYFPRAAGTDGVTLEASPTFRQDAAGNLVLMDLSGPREFWLSDVPTAPIFKRNGTAFRILGNTGDHVALQVGWAEFQDPATAVTFAGGQKVANGKSIEFSDGIDYNRGLGRFADGMLGPRDSAGSPMGWKDKGEVNVPQSSPPWACDSAHDGGTYRDSTGPGTRCECFFASGDGWINAFPGRVGSDCS